MKRAVIAAVTVLSLIFAGLSFAVEGIQPSAETDTNFEKMKAYHLKKVDDRINRLQEEKACFQAAKNQDDLKACRSKQEAEKKGQGDQTGRRGVHGDPGGQVPPPIK